MHKLVAVWNDQVHLESFLRVKTRQQNFNMAKRRHWDPARIRTWVFWMLVRCSYQLSHWSSGIGAEDRWCLSMVTLKPHVLLTNYARSQVSRIHKTTQSLPSQPSPHAQSYTCTVATLLHRNTKQRACSLPTEMMQLLTTRLYSVTNNVCLQQKLRLQWFMVKLIG